MIIALKKFGQTLTSREEGREAFAAFKPTLKNITEKEFIEVDFREVNTLSPSWADEFFIPLFKLFGQRLILKETDNLSVTTTLATLEEIHQIKFVRK